MVSLKLKIKLTILLTALALAVAAALYFMPDWLMASKNTNDILTQGMAKDTRTLVCLDPGHGGSDDPGASNQDIVIEKEINLMVANKVKNILEQNNYRIIMTRTSNDEAHNNNDRYTYCNTNKADILVSIHHNDFADPSVDYDTVLYYKNSDQALAESILTSTSQILGVSNNGITSFEDGVLSKSNMPAALSEAFFISSDYEFNQITKANSKRLNDEAQGIATGIMNYFKDMSVNTASGSL